ncbi:DUF5980 family protein [Streptomyces olivaceus]|uniref:DUF5980 family protein n=1 Tax=Streptomyces olivaceus TaxID=47716 RepID=UPI001CCBEE8A|nr:DUF5980 family protein [Streptomyces olivaceus]MBZ6304988.1 hypothetical protein [Streptomyces olivaceus]MBZ6317748.1 hypothetical protein [Streptomyces olivaceus]
MKKTCRRAGLLVGLASVIALPLVGAAPTSAVEADTWTLHGNNQYCVKPDRGWPRTYAVGAVEGTWSSTITAGLRKLPAGSTSDEVSTLAPGTNVRDPEDGGLTINIWLPLSIAPAPAGTYTAEFWADDGTVTQTDVVTIKVSEEC